MQQPDCHTCKLLRNFIEDLQSRIQLLFIELQQRPCHRLPETSRDDELQSRTTANEHLEGTNNSDGPSKSTERGWKCQDPDCFDKPKTLFTKHNNFVRHYSQHVKCNETCRFCTVNITNVREYVTHFERCEVKKKQEQLGRINPITNIEAIEQRRLLLRRVKDQLNQQPYTASGVGGEDALSVASDAHDVEAGRKRRRTMDPVPDMATEQISPHTIPPARGLHQDRAGPTSPSTSMQGSQTYNREAAVTSLTLDPDNRESESPSRIIEAPSIDSTNLLHRAPFARSYTIDQPFDGAPSFANSYPTDEPFDATQPPQAPSFAHPYTIHEAFSSTLPPQAPFAPSYTIDESFDETPQATLDASYSLDGGLGPVRQYPTSVATTIQQQRWTRSTGM